MQRVVNNTLQPIPLEGGAVIPAAGTPEAQPKDVELTEKDRKRYVERGWLSIIEAQETEPVAEKKAGSPSPAVAEAQSDSLDDKRRKS